MSSPAPQLRSRMPRLAEAAVDHVRLSVVPRARMAAPRLPFVALVTMVLLSGIVGLLLFNTSMQQSSFTATSLQEQATALDLREQALTMQLDQLRDPQRVAQRAERIGMVPAGPPAFLDLGSGKVLGSADPAGGKPLRIWPYPAPKPRVLAAPPRVVTVPAQPEAGQETGDRSGESSSPAPAATSPGGGE
jgi:hypothetical protein